MESSFSALTTQYLQHSVHHSVTELNRGITKWAKDWNENSKPLVRTKNADEIFASMRQYLEPIAPRQTSEEEHENGFGSQHIHS